MARLEQKVVLLASLYVAQGLPYGFFTQALPVLLREHGMSLPLIGLAHLLMLPWALKFLWAPVVDGVVAPRVGRRRAVILPLQVAGTALLAALALTGSAEAVWILCIGVLVINVISATQDIATDALAVEILTPDERGLGNGIQVGAYRTGMIVGGGAMLLVFGEFGWTAAFLGMAVVLALSTVPVLLHREAPPPIDDSPRRPLWPTIRASVRRPGMRRWIAVLVTFKTGEWFASGMLRPFLKDSGLTIQQIGTMLGIVGFSAALAGAIAGGIATPKLGRRRALILFGAIQAVALSTLALAVQMPSTGMFYAVTIAEHFTSSMATAALFTAMMDFCRTSDPGTDYTVQACILVGTTGVIALLSGVSAHALGYTGHFLLAAGVSVVGVLVAALYRPSDPAFAFVPASARSSTI